MLGSVIPFNAQGQSLVIDVVLIEVNGVCNFVVPIKVYADIIRYLVVIIFLICWTLEINSLA